MEWFVADTHFEHTNIIKYCNRPFANITEMNERILDNINSSVKPSDTLYHLGDFALPRKNIAQYREKIRCRNVILILGNHDPQTKGGQPHDKLYNIFSHVFVVLRIRPVIQNLRQPIILSHYAMRTWNCSHRGSWHLFGHSHGKLPDDGSMSFDVGVDQHNYHPLSIRAIANIMESPEENDGICKGNECRVSTSFEPKLLKGSKYENKNW